MSYFDYNSSVSIRDQHLQKRAERKAAGVSAKNFLIPELEKLDPRITLNKSEIDALNALKARRYEFGASLAVAQNDSLPFSAAFKNAVLPYKITPVETYDEAIARLTEILGKRPYLRESSNVLGEPIIFINSPEPVKILPITDNETINKQEAVIAYTNDILNTISKQVRGQSDKISVEEFYSPAFITYREIKTTELAKIVSDINKYKLVGESKIEQDPENPLQIAFLGKKVDDPIELVRFRNLDLAISALRGFKNDFDSLKQLDLHPTESNEQRALVMLSNFSQSYTPSMINFLTSNLTNLKLAA